MKILLALLLSPIIAKVIWVMIFRLRNEKKDILERANYLISKVATSSKQLESVQVEVPDYIETELPEFFENIISLHKTELLRKMFGSKSSFASQIVGNHEYFLNQMILITWERVNADFIEVSMYSFFPKEP